MISKEQRKWRLKTKTKMSDKVSVTWFSAIKSKYVGLSHKSFIPSGPTTNPIGQLVTSAHPHDFWIGATVGPMDRRADRHSIEISDPMTHVKSNHSKIRRDRYNDYEILYHRHAANLRPLCARGIHVFLKRENVLRAGLKELYQVMPPLELFAAIYDFSLISCIIKDFAYAFETRNCAF